MDIYDTRSVESDNFHPWMLGRFVEVTVHASAGWTQRFAGKLKTYSETKDKWTWRFTDAESLYERPKIRNSDGLSTGYHSYSTGSSMTFTVSVVTVLPNNWDHYGVDGSEATR